MISHSIGPLGMQILLGGVVSVPQSIPQTSVMNGKDPSRIL